MILKGKALDNLKIFLSQPATDWDPDIGDNPDPYYKILDWALDPEHGGLPSSSARAFAEWLSNTWADWSEDENASVKDVLEGAVSDWCGGRTFG